MNNYIWAFDIGGTSIKYTLANNNEFLVYDEIEINQLIGGPSIISLIKDILDSHSEIIDYGIAISAPGVIDTNHGKVVDCSSTITNYLGINYIDELSEYTNKIVVENDLNCAALGEYSLHNNISSFYQINIGTGVGGAFILNGELYTGYQFKSGEIGRLIINDEPLDESGSTRGLLNRIQLSDNSITNGKILIEKLKIDSSCFDKEISLFFDSICKIITVVKYVLNPQLIIIGGGISESNEFILNGISNWSKNNSNSLLDTNIKCAISGNKAGLLGALKIYSRGVSKKC